MFGLSFLYLWKSSIEVCPDSLKELIPEGLFESEYWEEPERSAIFSVGIATRDAKNTSKALRFLAYCCGMANLMEKGKGGLPFERVVALHCCRLLHCFGYTVKEYILHESWPTQLTKPSRKNKWGESRRELETIAELLKEEMSAVVVTPRCITAQGVDVFCCIRTKTNVRVNVIQCSRDGEAVLDGNAAINSLGLILNPKNGKVVLGSISPKDPEHGKVSKTSKSTLEQMKAVYAKAREVALYNEEAIDVFQNVLRNVTKLDVDVRRVVAVSSGMDEIQTKGANPKTLVSVDSMNVYEVWRRDFFEPTISSVPLSAT